MSKFRYFELEEFTASSKAKEKGIDNTPTFEIVDNLSELVENFLEPLRAAFGRPINVTSGYRCPKLNQLVGGVATSAHKNGYAADVVPGSGSVEELYKFVTEWVKAYGVRFDQIFLETKKDSKWLHIGYKNSRGQQRGIVSTLNIMES